MQSLFFCSLRFQVIGSAPGHSGRCLRAWLVDFWAAAEAPQTSSWNQCAPQRRNNLQNGCDNFQLGKENDPLITPTSVLGKASTGVQKNRGQNAASPRGFLDLERQKLARGFTLGYLPALPPGAKSAATNSYKLEPWREFVRNVTRNWLRVLRLTGARHVGAR